MARQNRLLSAGDLFAMLHRLPQGVSDAARLLCAWRTISRAASPADLLVALDYAAEHALVPERIINAMRAGDAAGKGESIVNEIDGSELIWIPRGRFYVGANRKPAISEGFFLARHPVTNRQFKQFLDETQYTPHAPDAESFLSHWTKRGSIPKRKEEHPVVWVSFFDALQYCRWAGMMLPTEWLWEKAARGPEGRESPWGDGAPEIYVRYGSPLTALAQVAKESTAAVGSYERTRTPYGCEDLIGNVSEWCLPGEVDEQGQAVNAGEMPGDWPIEDQTHSDCLQMAAVRGSAYMRKQHARMVSCHRRRLSATRRNHWVGFRPALMPAPHPQDA